MSNGIEVPGRVNINPRVIDGPTAMPAHVVLQEGTRYNVFMLGGLSKLEWATVMVGHVCQWDAEICAERAKALLDAAQALERGAEVK